MSDPRSIPSRLDALPPRVLAAARWVAFLVTMWVVLRPALTITISGDDLINPFYVFDDYGPSPLGMFDDVSRDLTRAGHFNHIGQNAGAVVFVLWAYLIGWGVRYSLIYATTKFVVFVVTVLLAARLLRTLSDLYGRPLSLWWSRVAVAAVLLPALQIHVLWSHDPVASFPLSGYLSAAIGVWALDESIRALRRDDRRSVVIAAVALVAAILYYEINVVVVAALVPVVVVLARRARGDRGDRRPLVRALLVRAAVIVAPAAVITLVLQRVAAAANRGYTGTDVAVGEGSTGTLVRSLLGSLPASAWRVARDELGRSIDVAAVDVLTIVVVVGALALVARALLATSPAVDPVGEGGDRRWPTVLLIAAVPAILWLGATVVQASTAKVRAETLRVGYVYNFYAYGTIGVALAAILLARPAYEVLVRRRRSAARPIAAVVALALLAGAGAQVVVNGAVQREFDARLSVSDDVLNAFADEAPEAERCAALAAWRAVGFWLDYYRTDFTEGLQVTYEHFHGEPFCGNMEPGG